MRSDNLEFDALNKDTIKEPVIVIGLSFDSDNTDIHYLTSHELPDLTGNVINDTLAIVSSTSQKITPEKAHSTIGNIKFECLDVGLTALQRTKLSESKGLKSKRVQVFFGYKGLPWNKFVVVNTQIISKSILYKDGVFTFQCSDVQRLARKKLFVLKETTLISSLANNDTTLNVANTSEFQAVFNPNVNGALAPGETVGFLKIEKDGVFEIIKWTGKTATTFTGCTRGVLGTPKLEFSVESGERGPVVEEFVYMSAPSIMVAYALYTGSWYGHAGKFLPDHWHLGVSTDYLKTSDFLDFPDLWDTNDLDKGVQATVAGVNDEDGKRFIETQIYYMLSLYSPINSSGEIGLKRLSFAGSTGETERVLNADNVVSYGDLNYDTDAVVNRFLIKWDYSIVTDSYRRASGLIDPDSIATHGASDIKVIKLRTLFGNNDSQKVINHNFENLRARTSSPPYRLPLELTPDQNDLEVGDVVTVDLDELEDINGQGSGFKRNMEVQSVRVDWANGHVKVDLVGASENMSTLTPVETETLNVSNLAQNVPSDNMLTPSNTRFTGNISSSNGITHITGDIHLTGHANLKDGTAIYYCPEELQIDAGVTVTHDLNVQIRTPEYFTVNGTLDGSGRGLDGVTDTRAYAAVDTSVYDFGGPKGGTPGGVGVTSAGYKITYDNPPYANDTQNILLNGRSGGHVVSTNNEFAQRLPNLFIHMKDGDVDGLPDSLIGTVGPHGGAVLDALDKPHELVARGGASGKSGAGLCIISAGFDLGTNGKIDLSGEDGLTGESQSMYGITLQASSGAGGHTGGLLILSLDSTQYTEQPSDSKTLLNNGISPIPPGNPANRTYTSAFYTIPNPGWTYHSRNYGKDTTLTNYYQDFARVMYLDAVAAYETEQEEYVGSDPSFTVTEYTNTPVTPEGNQSTLEVSVTPPADSNYSHSLVEYRKQGESAWTSAPPASHESVFVVESDGSTYEVRLRPVSKAGTPTLTGPVQAKIVTSVSGQTDAQLATIYPLGTIAPIAIQGEAGTVFTGLDANFEWSDENNSLTYFNYYEIEVWSGTQILRTEKSVSPFYSYSFTKNVADHVRLNGARAPGSAGAYLSITVKVKAVSKYFNDQAALYASSASSFTATASTTDNPDNLRFHQIRQDTISANFASMATQTDITNLQDQIDGNITTWFYTGVPTLSNDPAVNWTTDATKDAHIGDLYYDEATQYAYRFKKVGSVYSWEHLSDSAFATALTAANAAQDTADSKRRVYLATPTVPYDAGDLWIDSNNVKAATVAKTDAQSYAPADWTIVADYTTNTNQLTDGANLGGTADWSGVTGTGKPEDNANHTTNTNQLTDGANLGGTANWSGVSGTGKPADNATVGATWGSNIIGQPSDAAILNSNQQWDAILGSLKPEDNATAGATWGSDITGQPANAALLNDQQQWDDILGSTKPADNADVTDYADPRIDNNLATPYTLVASSGMKVEGAKVTKTGTSGTWDAQVYSQESYTGGVIASWIFEAVSKAVMVGLNTDPELNGHYSSIDYALYCNTSGNLYRYKSGSQDGVIAAMSHGDNVAIVYDNVDVIYYHNGVEVYRDLDVGADIKFYLDSSFASENARISSLQFGPYGSKSWAAISGSGKPADNADVTNYADSRIDNNNATPYSLVKSSTMTVEGSTVERTSGTSNWDAQVYSKQSYRSGAVVSFTLPLADKSLMVGFDGNPSEDANYTNIDYCLFVTGTGLLYRYKSGSHDGQIGTVSAGDRVTIIYDNVDVIYYVNGVEIYRDIDVGTDREFYLDSSFHHVGGRIENLQFGPFASRDWASIGGANKPEDNANHTTNTNQLTDGANLGGTAAWSGVSGAGKPQDNATVGATWGSDIGGQPSDDDLLNNRLDSGVTTIPRPLGAAASGGNNQAGAIVIVLPHGWTNTMMRMTVDVFFYSASKSFSLNLAGYNYAGSGAWINTTAQLIGSTYSDNRVRFGINSAGKCCIVIGEQTSVWGYPKVMVKDFQAGFTNYSVDSWKDGWSVMFEDDLSDYTFTRDHADSLIDAKAIKNQGNLATRDTADWSSQVSGSGKPQNNATAGATWGADISGQPSDTQLLNSNTTPADIGFTGDLNANYVDNTNQLIDGAALGMTANWANVGGTGKPQDNATAGATWGTNIANVPNHLTEIPTDGLNLTAGYLGYYYSGTWRSYMDNQGRFYLNRYAPDHYLMWNGSILTVRGDIHATSIDASVINSLNLNAINISGGNIVGTSISGNTITGSTITGSTLKTSDSAERIEINESDNALLGYWDRGDGTIIQNIRVGSNNDLDSAVSLGNSNYDGPALYARSKGIGNSTIEAVSSGTSITGTSTSGSGYGVTGICSGSINAAVLGQNSGSSGYGVWGYSGNQGVRGQGATYDFYAAGSGTNYGPFTGAHDALLPKVGPAFQEGDIVKIVSIAARSTLSNVLASVELQDQGEAKNSYGVLVNSLELPDDNNIASMSALSDEEYQAFKGSHYICAINGLGEGQINVVSEGGDIEVGDFICTSSIPGKGKLYSGNDMRKVVAKAIEPINWADETSTEKQIACIYMCS